MLLVITVKKWEKINSMLKTIKTLLAASLIAASSTHAAANLSTLIPQEVHSKTMQEIILSLNSGHYNKIEIDDDLSSDLLDKYIDDLDPSRIYFLQSDIDQFEKYRYVLDDDLLAGRLEKGYEIFNLLQVRTHSFLTWAVSELEQKQRFDYSIDETLDTDRSNDPWAKSNKELSDLWRKRVKGAMLNLVLADKTEDDARQTLIKRYKNQLNRLMQAKSEDVFQRYANAFTKHFDPHTSYFSPRNSENFKINMSLSLEGIGAVLQSENENTKIVRLVPAGPADKTGQLKPSDLIVGVGQGNTGEIEDVVGWRLDDVVDKIRGPKGSTVRLEIVPADSKDQVRKVVSIERNTVKLEEQAAQKRIIKVNHKGIEYRVGVVDIPAFYIDFAALQRGDENYKSTTRDVEKLIKELEQEGIDGLIIDLRNNGGGSLREANELVGLFIDRGPTVQIQDSTGRVNILGDFNPKIAYTGPMAVVVNRLSASASEIFAGAIQDYRRGIVLGGQTFGKGTVQTLRSLDHGQLKLTNAKFYRISGASTQNKGVIPDIHFPSLFNKDDIGESSLEGALPWDEVAEARHGAYPDFKAIISELERRHMMRIDNQPDFNYLKEQIDHLADIREEETVPLQKAKLKEKREKAELWQVDAENRRRLAKGETPISKLSDLDNLLEKDEKGAPISAESEAILQESGHILIDFLYLTAQQTTAQK